MARKRRGSSSLARANDRKANPGTLTSALAKDPITTSWEKKNNLNTGSTSLTRCATVKLGCSRRCRVSSQRRLSCRWSLKSLWKGFRLANIRKLIRCRKRLSSIGMIRLSVSKASVTLTTWVVSQVTKFNCKTGWSNRLSKSNIKTCQRAHELTSSAKGMQPIL